MNWYTEKVSPKISTIVGLGVLSIVLTICFVLYKNDTRKLSDCSIYTVGKITTVYTIKGQTRAIYQYQLNSRLTQTDKGITTYNTGELLTVDMNKLSKRRLLVQVYCDDINVHRIIWDVAVPDTLQHIPAEGWKDIPGEFPKTKLAD